MKRYVAVLGRQPRISVAELESLYREVKFLTPVLAEFRSENAPEIRRLGGTMKIAEPIEEPIEKYLQNLPGSGKITLGVSDFSRKTSPYLAQREALRLKRVLVKAGRSVRIVPNQTAVLSNATSLHNRLFNENKIELIKNGREYYRVIQLSNIEDYAKRDQKRPARDAKVGMLPPKLAQILINLCGELPEGARVLDPFCGTGVLLQEAVLDGYVAYGTDVSERMVEYSRRNLEWLRDKRVGSFSQPASIQPVVTGVSRSSSVVTSGWSRKMPPTLDQPDRVNALEESDLPFATIEVGDATSYQWQGEIDAVACEAYLGPPMSLPPAEIKLKEAKQECGAIIAGFLKNLAEQIKPGTPVVVAVPAWLRPDGHYEHLDNLDEIVNLRYNVSSFKNLGQKDLLYARAGQVVAREIIVLRKK